MSETSADRPELARALADLDGEFAGRLLAAGIERGELDIRPAKEALRPVLERLKAGHGFNALEDIAVFDNLGRAAEGGERFTVVYRLYRFPGGLRARLAVDVAEGGSVPSIVPVYRSADWPEREAYDMFGVLFEGHPDLRRIYMPDEFEGHPLRKDFPLAGRTGAV